ncbi:putative disease resistance protein RGA3 [Phalaenopsis equestris]|uniref:putative disease resistance protein RGA3 n=1 Tax=Phalaenopsis equestris TaxID=78828 RepID=UPI0009E3F002|nr:putative disease resistance protein RGA3 [Phalaenopsis equestris]
MADWFVGPVMDKIINACSDYLQDQCFRWQTGMKEELERLRENHHKIQAVVSAYTRAQITDRNPALKRWIWQLRDAIDEADDVLDDFEYMKLEEEQQELNMEETKVRSSFSRLFLEPARKLRRLCKQALKIDPNLERLEAAVKKLDKVSAEVTTFLHLIENAKQEQQELELQLCKDRETGSLPNNDLIGRGEEKDFVMHGSWWHGQDNSLTTHNKKRPRLESLPAVQESLKAVVRSKRFLLVPDDIWEEDESKYENVLSPLTNGSFGSKILITSRMDAVASAIANIIKKKMETLRIKGLKENVCLKLLNTHAFAGVENLGAYTKLSNIASLIVKKLSGSRLAAKIVGGILNSNLKESFWMNILNSSDVLNVELESGRNNILPILRLSFTFLPQLLQNCYAFCGIFPQDHEFDKDDLVRMWIALGFIQESSMGGETLEDIGGRTNDPGLTEILTEIFKASRSIRLLFIDSPYKEKMSEAIKNLRHLRYLKFTRSLTQMPRSLSSLYHLRFIICKNGVLESCSDDFLPGDVSNLSNQRHLEMPPNAFSSVPGIGKLRSLQELNEFNVKNENGYRIGELEHMSELRKLKINFLENVKDAGEAGNAKLFEKRKLTELFLNWGKTVNKWKLEGGDRCEQNIVNSELDVNVLEILEPYKNLKRLSIVSHEGACSAKWMYNTDLISNLEYICLNGCSEWEALPPFGQLPHLKSLYLCNMPKAKRLDYKFHGNDKVSVFPSLEVLNIMGLLVLEDWFDGAAANDCFFPCLTELSLVNCPNLQELPYLPPKLRKMKIQNIGWKAALIYKQETNNCCLETLRVLSCPNITSLHSVGGRQQLDSGIEKFQVILSQVVIDDSSLLLTVSIASLEKLTICNDDVLQSLPSFLERLSSLKILHVENVPRLQQLLHIPTSLKELHLKYLESLQCLPASLSAISFLKVLWLKNIPLLKSLPSSLSAISSLKHVFLDNIPLLKSLPDLPLCLSHLLLQRLDNLQCLPSSLSAVSSLNVIWLFDVPLLKSLPDLPSSLNSIMVKNCHPEFGERYKKFSGSDWHKIARIPNVSID